MPDLADGETTEVKGSGAKPYVLRNTGGVYSCSCPAWRNQSIAIEKRSCKHLKKLRGDAAELARVGPTASGAKPVRAKEARGSAEGLPATPLDGELWGGLDAPFEDRLASAGAQLQPGTAPYARQHEHVRCEGAEHLRAELARVEGLSGEGLMLRQPGSRYEVGRSSTLLEVKSFSGGEATVLQHQPGAGRHKGRVGALLVELRDGTRFSLGTGLSDVERRSPPAIGSVVTFRYQELSDGGVPRFPTYVGPRDDVALEPPEDVS